MKLPMLNMRLRNYGLLATCLALIASLVVGNLPASALSGSDWRAGNIISDAAFFDGNSMTTPEVQSFLAEKVPSCDTNGSLPYAGTTRRAYSEARGYFPPYTCVKDYRQDVPAKSAESGLCNGISAGNRSAAEIISDVGRSCGINQRVLMVLLQKEQSLITDDWPWSIQYRSATGYGCPDTAACDSTYYGFFNQVYMAARQFKRYARDANLFNYRAGQTANILYSPGSGCGSSSVYIENQATAGLYNYTPYQPNASALANLYGTGDSCGSYGNRNFWRLYNDWFSAYIPLSPLTDTVTRLVNGKGKHMFTAYDSEVQFITRFMNYKNDGFAFKSKVDESDGAVPVYQLYNGRTQDYLLTPDGPDFYWALVHAGYRNDGIKFYAYTTQQSGTIPVYRLWHGGRADHFYTTSGNDVYFCLNYDGYLNDGIKFYVPTP